MAEIVSLLVSNSAISDLLLIIWLKKKQYSWVDGDKELKAETDNLFSKNECNNKIYTGKKYFSNSQTKGKWAVNAKNKDYRNQFISYVTLQT